MKKSDLQWDCMELQKYSSRSKELTEGFLRPVYQYTKCENPTVDKLHENDYLKALKDWRC